MNVNWLHISLSEIRVIAVNGGLRLLQMSFSGALIILLVVAVRAFALYKLPKKTFTAMWGIALARLLIPFQIASPFSVYALLILQGPAGTGASHALPAAPLLEIPAASPGASQTAAEARRLDMAGILTAVWLIGTVACGLFFLIVYLRCRREFQTSLPVQSGYVDSWLARRRMKRAISVRQTSAVSAPLSYGLFRPVILLPKTFDLENETALQYVLVHEYVHIRRFDALTKGMIILAACVHWFNPLAWVMYILANRDMELTCDETVIRRLGQECKAGYAGVLIAMVESSRPAAPFGNHFSRTAIEERITALVKSRKASALTVTLALFLVIATAAVFATSPGTAPDEILAGQEDWVSEYREWVTRQAAADYVNGEKMSARYKNVKGSYMYSYVSPDRSIAIYLATAALEQMMDELEPGEVKILRLKAEDGSRIEINAGPDICFQIEIYARNGNPLATYVSTYSEPDDWSMTSKFHLTADEEQFRQESDALYLAAYLAAETAGITAADAPVPAVPDLSVRNYAPHSFDGIHDRIDKFLGPDGPA